MTKYGITEIEIARSLSIKFPIQYFQSGVDCWYLKPQKTKPQTRRGTIGTGEMIQ